MDCNRGQSSLLQPILLRNEPLSGISRDHQHEECTDSLPLDVIRSVRLLHDIQCMPGPHGAYAGHLAAFMRRCWWQRMRPRIGTVPNAPRQSMNNPAQQFTQYRSKVFACQRSMTFLFRRNDDDASLTDAVRGSATDLKNDELYRTEANMLNSCPNGFSVKHKPGQIDKPQGGLRLDRSLSTPPGNFANGALRHRVPVLGLDGLDKRDTKSFLMNESLSPDSSSDLLRKKLWSAGVQPEDRTVVCRDSQAGILADMASSFSENADNVDKLASKDSMTSELLAHFGVSRSTCKAILRLIESFPSVERLGSSGYVRSKSECSDTSNRMTCLEKMRLSSGLKLRIPLECECSWENPPTVYACVIQSFLANEQRRNLGPLVAPNLCKHYDTFLMEYCVASKHSQSETGKKKLNMNLDYPEVLVQLMKGPGGCVHADWDIRQLQASMIENGYKSFPSPARKDLCLWIGAYSIPRDDKRHRGGEDAWYMDPDTNSFGVADGVSEWQELAGINPQSYAEDLMKGTQLKVASSIGDNRNSNRLDACKLTKKDSSSSSSGDLNCEASLEGSTASSGSVDLSTNGATIGDSASLKSKLNPADVARQALTYAYHNSKNYGSSTAIAGVLDAKSGNFGIANLGDSSGMVLRRQQLSTCCSQLSVVKRVKEMQHEFNVPYQFAHLPEPVEWDELLTKGMNRLVELARQEYEEFGNMMRIGDEPSAIQTVSVQVQEGDLILLGTDGLFDNVFDFEVTGLTGVAISPFEADVFVGDPSLATPPEDVARSLALAAYWRSLDGEAQTPFSKEARRHSNFHAAAYNRRGSEDGVCEKTQPIAGTMTGGKEDDITVTAAWVVSRERCVHYREKNSGLVEEAQRSESIENCENNGV